MKLSRDKYIDKVLGCLLGKIVGGALGGSLEELYGREEMYDVWWYPRIDEKAFMNDDFEI